MSEQQENQEEDRFATALKFANELGKARLLESKKNRQKQWTPEKRAEQAAHIRSLKPWKRSTGPKTVQGKASSARNAFQHGWFDQDMKRVLAMLRVQRYFVAAAVQAQKKDVSGSDYARTTLMIELDELYKKMRDSLAQAGVETPELDARLLILSATGLSHADLITDKTRPISDSVLARVQEHVARRLTGEPVSRILGEREFWGLSFEVTPATLDPRPDTETLVEAALKWARTHPKNQEGAARPPACGHGAFKILDLGTGTGCILVALLSELPNATGIGVDMNPETVEIARRNVMKHGMSDRISIVQGNWFEGLEAESFDLIVSNPPYIPNPDIENLSVEVKNHDPIMALASGNDGLDDYKKIIFGLKNYLNEGNRAFLEIGVGQLSDLSRLVDESNLCLCDSVADIAGIPRVVEISRGDK